jgi:WhiB family transcriptional regulator, redox-sensing transcriptional regulator
VKLHDIWARAACRGTANRDIFFPTRNEGPNGAEAAKSVCEGCPVRVECLEYALEAEEEFGVWGGTTPAERRRMK